MVMASFCLLMFSFQFRHTYLHIRIQSMEHRGIQFADHPLLFYHFCHVCYGVQSENVSIKDLQKVLVTVPTLEYHNQNWTWTDMLLEVKRDYKNAIIHQVHTIYIEIFAVD